MPEINQDHGQKKDKKIEDLFAGGCGLGCLSLIGLFLIVFVFTLICGEENQNDINIYDQMALEASRSMEESLSKQLDGIGHLNMNYDYLIGHLESCGYKVTGGQVMLTKYKSYIFEKSKIWGQIEGDNTIIKVSLNAELNFDIYPDWENEDIFSAVCQFTSIWNDNIAKWTNRAGRNIFAGIKTPQQYEYSDDFRKYDLYFDNAEDGRYILVIVITPSSIDS